MIAASGEPLIELNGVSYGYGKAPFILEDISLSFRPGSVHAITGPSGCGKSTLLYLAGLMLRPAAGSIRVCSMEVGRATDSERSAVRASSIGFVFQDALLEPSMTVLESVTEAVGLRRKPSRFRNAALEHLELLGVAELASRKTARLSGGQAQRVGVARALLGGPAIVLADEPTGNLDDQTAAVVLDELFRYGHQPDRTTIIVTHDERVAQRADQIHRLTCPQPRQAIKAVELRS